MCAQKRAKGAFRIETKEQLPHTNVPIRLVTFVNLMALGY